MLREATEAAMKAVVSRGHLHVISNNLRVWMQEAEEAARDCAETTIAGGLVSVAEGRSNIEIDRIRLSAVIREIHAEHGATVMKFRLAAQSAEGFFKRVEKERSKFRGAAASAAEALEIAQKVTSLCKSGKKEMQSAINAIRPLSSAGLLPSVTELGIEVAGELKTRFLPLAKTLKEGALSASARLNGYRVAIKGKRMTPMSNMLRRRYEAEAEAAKKRAAQATKSLQALSDATDAASIAAAVEPFCSLINHKSKTSLPLGGGDENMGPARKAGAGRLSFLASRR